MTLSDYFLSEGISTFASLPADAPPIVKPRLMARVDSARTAVFAAIPYYAEGGASNLAMFARGRDYHALAQRLAREASALLAERHPGCAAAGFADHSPYDEVAGAAMAGLGVIGDNGLLITERYSSYVFIFALITSLTAEELDAEEIPRGKGEIRLCAHCGACAAACPGGCIGAGRASCLSAISQKKGELSEAEAAMLRAAPCAWGCDACQEACPHTAAARAAGTLDGAVPYFREARITHLTADAVRAMPDEEYQSYAFGWRRKEIMIRNLEIQGT